MVPRSARMEDTDRLVSNKREAFPSLSAAKIRPSASAMRSLDSSFMHMDRNDAWLMVEVDTSVNSGSCRMWSWPSLSPT